MHVVAGYCNLWTRSSRVHPEAARATLSRPARRFNAGASERSRPLWPGMNVALAISGGKHVQVMKSVRVGQERAWQRSGRPQTRDVVC